MIEFLSKWIEGIAIAVIIASIFEMILPNGNIKKYVKAISLYVSHKSLTMYFTLFLSASGMCLK